MEAMAPGPAVPATTAPDGSGGMGGAPMEVAPAARAYAEDAAQAAAAMPASGEAAVAASSAQNAMQNATAVESTNAAHFVAGKTFVQQGWVTGAGGATLPFWVDTAYDQEMKLRWVEFASDAYFALTVQPEMAAWLDVGQEMVIVVSETEAIRVTTNAEEIARQGNVPMSPLPTPPAAPSAPASEAPEASGQGEEPRGWDAFWSWLWGN